jgi:hypothetical protein
MHKPPAVKRNAAAMAGEAPVETFTVFVSRPSALPFASVPMAESHTAATPAPSPALPSSLPVPAPAAGKPLSSGLPAGLPSPRLGLLVRSPDEEPIQTITLAERRRTGVRVPRRANGKALWMLKCQYCDYHSDSANNILRHERSHTGEKPFGCTFCPYRSARSDDLNKHMQRHSTRKLKPCTAPGCTFATPDSAVFRRHMKARHPAGVPAPAAAAASVGGVGMASTTPSGDVASTAPAEDAAAPHDAAPAQYHDDAVGGEPSAEGIAAEAVAHAPVGSSP